MDMTDLLSRKMTACWFGNTIKVRRSCARFPSNPAPVLDRLVGTSLPAKDGYSIAAYSDDLSLIAAASNGGVVRIWDVSTGSLVSEWVSAVPNPNQILFHPNDTRMVVGNAQSLAQVWDIASSLSCYGLQSIG